MTDNSTDDTTIIRIAAKGDGVTADGRYVAGAAPGDVLRENGSLVRGPNYAVPPCRHFTKCGGCQLQHLGEAALAAFVTDRVVHGAAGQGLVAEVAAPAHLSPPGSRRRASLHAARVGGRVVLGYREAGSHTIVDLAECPVLVPELAALLGPIRQLLARRDGRIAVDVELSLADQGADVALKGLSVEGLAQTEALLDFARDVGLARLSLDQGYGPEGLWEPEPVTITLAGVPVSLPPGAFLQATADGEDASGWRQSIWALMSWPICSLALAPLPLRWRGLGGVPRCWRQRLTGSRTWPARRRQGPGCCPWPPCTATCFATHCSPRS